MSVKLNNQQKVEILINIPTPLRVYTNNQKSVKISATTIKESIEQLVELYPLLKPHLFNEDGSIRNFVNIYLDGEDIRYLPDGLATMLKTGSNINIVPSIAGG